MNNSAHKFERDDRSWSLRLIKNEIDQLKREERHLKSKEYERPLSLWERSRLGELLHEMRSLIDELRKFSEQM